MKDLDEYKLKLKIKYLGELVWSVLVKISKCVLFLFFMLTAFSFWQKTAIDLLSRGINITGQVVEMLAIVLIMVSILVIDKLKNLTTF